jgi:flagella basal body P-ring formation protein FlgA
MTTMLRTIALLALLAVNTEALGQTVAALTIDTPTLRQHVTVDSDLVRIGDLVENAGAAADVPVFRSPDLGETGAVPVKRIVDALRPHAVIGLNTAGISEVAVTRASRAIPPQEVEARIIQALVAQNKLRDPRNVDLVLDRELRTIHVDPAVTGELLAARVSFEPRSGRFDIGFELPRGAVSRNASIRVTGTAIETADSVTLLRSLARGEILRSSDVVLEKRPRRAVGGDSVGSLGQAVGRAARQPLRAGQMLRQSDLTKPELVQRNDTVLIVYEAPGITLTLRGKAIDGGGEGDTIGVLNLQSKRTIQAVVSGPGRVVVSAPRTAGAFSNFASNGTSQNRAE